MGRAWVALAVVRWCVEAGRGLREAGEIMVHFSSLHHTVPTFTPIGCNTNRDHWSRSNHLFQSGSIIRSCLTASELYESAQFDALGRTAETAWAVGIHCIVFTFFSSALLVGPRGTAWDPWDPCGTPLCVFVEFLISGKRNLNGCNLILNTFQK